MTNTKNNFSTTENGASAYLSTNQAVLDAFSSLPNMKNSAERLICDTFFKAFFTDREAALRLLFYIRDIRGGQGSRRVFRVIINEMVRRGYEEDIIKNFDNIAFFGRYDDYLCLLDTKIAPKVADYFLDKMNDPIEHNLVCKWLPSENASSETSRKYARQLAKLWKITPKEYRAFVVSHRMFANIVERAMSSNHWEDIDFSKVPAKASIKYRNAFYSHTPEKYKEYLVSLINDRVKAKADSLFPVDIIHPLFNFSYRSRTDDRNISKMLADAQWKALPNYFKDSNESILCVVDTSGSMFGQPMETAVALGIYCADKCKGPFKDHFVTFSANPTLISLRDCPTIFDKVQKTMSAEWGMNTNIAGVFKLILDTAISNNLKQEDLPSKICIISDMQFDQSVYDCSDKNKNKQMVLMDAIKRDFEKHNYKCPSIIYWNVRESNCAMYQATFNAIDCAIVGGYSPSLFKAIIEGTFVTTDDTNTKITETLTPMSVMHAAIYNERYDRVVT